MTTRRLAPTSTSPAPAAAPDALKLWVVLSRAHAAILRHVEADIARHRLTVAEFGVLEALHHKGPLLLGELQRKLLVSSGGVTYLVDRLVARGLVARDDCAEDRRARYARLTAKGTAFIAGIFPAHQAAISAAVSGLAPAEQARAIALLRTLGRAAEALPAADDQG